MAVSLWKIWNTVITWCRGGSFHKCVLDIAASGLNAGFLLDMFELPDVLVKVEVTEVLAAMWAVAIGVTHGLVEGCTSPCNNLSSVCWHTVPCWCIGTLLGTCLIVGWSPVSIQCCTIPICPRSDSPDKKISVNSSKMLVSSFLCELLRFRAPGRTVWTLRASFVSAS